MDANTLRHTTRHPEGLRTLASLRLVPSRLNPYGTGPMLWWPCAITGRLHGIALNRHRGRGRHAMRLQVQALMRDGTPAALEAKRLGSLRHATDKTPEAVAAYRR